MSLISTLLNDLIIWNISDITIRIAKYKGRLVKLFMEPTRIVTDRFTVESIEFPIANLKNGQI